MRRKSNHLEAIKKEAVSLLLDGYRTESVARKLEVNPVTVRRWLKQYEDEVDLIMAQRRSKEERMQEAAEQLPVLKEKYQKAIKLLGEKELEIEILRELVKKKHPDWKPPLSGSKKDML